MLNFKNALVWPEGVPHTKERKITRCKTTWLAAVHELEKVVKLTGIKNVSLTANLNVGLNVIHSRRPGQRGVSLYYTSGNKWRLAYCDQYFKEADNLMAIVKTLRSYNDIKMRKVGFQNFELKTG